jgi:hypothetical protein
MSSASKQKLSTAYANIDRVDQLAVAETRRVDGLLKAQETAVQAALAAAKEAVAAALASSEKAVTKAEVAQAGVNAGQNEFRGTLRDQAQRLMPRIEAENLIRELRGLIAAQAEVITGLRSRLDVGPPSLSQLQTRSDEQVGRMRGSLDTRTVVFSIIGAAVGVIAAVGYIIAAIKP